MLNELLPAGIFAFLLVFSRIGAAVMLIPGFGEAHVPPRVRLTIALGVALLATPLVAPLLPAPPASPLGLPVVLGHEIVIGLMIGVTARIMISALHVAGTVIAFHSSLSTAQFFDPAQGQQGALISSFLGLIGLILIFATNLHLVMLRATYESYSLMPPSASLPVEDAVQMVVGLVAGAFQLGVQLAAPFIVYAMVYYIGLGLLQRLMPQIQLFFVGLPLQILMALFVLMVTITGIMMWFLDGFESQMANWLAR